MKRKRTRADDKKLHENIAKARQGDDNAFEFLCKHYTPRIKVLIKKYQNQFKDFLLEEDDMLQAGYIALWKWVTKDPYPTFNELTFYYLREFTRLLSTCRTINLTRYVTDTHNPSHHINFKKDKIISSTNCFPYDDFDEDETKEFHTNFEEDVLNQTIYEQILTIAQKILNTKYYEIFYLRYIFHWTYRQIGEYCNVTTERARQCDCRIKKKLREHIQIQKIAREEGYL